MVVKFLGTLLFFCLTACAIAQPLSVIQNNFYVSPSGLDTNNICVISTAPCLTITHAVNEAMSQNAGGSIQSIHLSNGTWNENVFVTGQSIGAGTANSDEQILIEGEGPENTSWNGVAGQCGVLTANQGANVGVRQLSIGNISSSCGSDLYANLGGFIQVFDGILFNATTNCHMYAEESGSIIEVWDSYEINADYGSSAFGDMCAFTGSTIELATPGTTVYNYTPETMRGAFLVAGDNATIFIDGKMSYYHAGALVSGYSCFAYMNGVIDTGGTGVPNLPGSLGAKIQTGGQCN